MSGVDQDDPTLWSVERVIQELCHHDNPVWMKDTNLKRLDHPDLVEPVLRANDIDGEALLDLKEDNLRSDLEIKSFGQRNRLVKIINHLRRCSGRYSALSPTPEIARTLPMNDMRFSRTPDLHSEANYKHFATPTSIINPSHPNTEQFNRISSTHTQPLKREAAHLIDGSLLNGLENHVERELGGEVANSGGPQRTIADKPYIESGQGKRRRIAPETIAVPQANVADSSRPYSAFFQPVVVAARSNVMEIESSSTSSQSDHVAAEDAEYLDDYPADVAEEIKHDFAEFPGLKHLLLNHPAREHEVLPLYGESEEEDRYVTEGSISDHDDETTVSAAVSAQPYQLSKSEVDNVIDQAVARFEAEIADRTMNKIMSIGHSQWKIVQKYPRYRTRLLRSAETRCDQLRKRMEKLRSHIHDCIWTTIAEVRDQCETLTPTVEQIQEVKYVVKVLRENNEPPLPEASSRKRAKVSRKQVPGEDETYDTNDEGLDEFLVSESDTSQSEDSRPDDNEWTPQPAGDVNQLSHSSDVDITDADISTIQPKSAMDFPGLGNDLVSSSPANPASQAQSSIGPESQGNSRHPILPVIKFPVQDTAFATNTEAVNAVQDAGTQKPPQTPSRSSTARTVYDDTDADDERDPGIVAISAKRVTSAKKRAFQERTRQNSLIMPESTELSDDELNDGSDLDRPAQLPKTHFRKFGRTPVQPIDLTCSSPLMHDSDFDIRTPDLNATELDQHTPSKGKERASDREPPHLELASKSLPDFKSARDADVRTINDPSVALAKRVYALEKDYACFLLSYAKSLNNRGASEVLEDVLTFLNIDGEDNATLPLPKKDHEVAKLMTSLFITYVGVRQLENTQEACELVDAEDASQEMLETAFEEARQSMPDFRYLLIELLNYRVNYATTRTKLGDTSLGTESEAVDDTEAALETGTDADAAEDHNTLAMQGLKHRRAYSRSSRPTSSDNIQVLAKQRVRAQARRKEMLAQKLEGVTSADGIALVPVNFKEPIVYLAEDIARVVKPHQINGIQFMWRELIEDPKQQGCLLAHTMGLGKTMQVVSVLVAIAQCNESGSPRMRHHIPKHLRQPRILILCPVSLVSNWYDELLMWMPTHDMLGTLTKIDEKCKEPYNDIKAWAQMGGVLILPYTRFTSYCKMSKARASLTEEQQKNLTYWLLERPSIVIADEAHALKNPEAQKTVTAMKLKSSSRIALTGSPLSNHLEEYWGLINFVAPGYLGSLRSFQTKFSEPINRSLTVSSKPYERRVGLKKMHMLKKILDPKVDRADITAIKKDLSDKVEFYITVPLTDLQKEAYRLYVRYFKAAVISKKASGRVLTWISILSLLLNHPHCFINKLKQAQLQAGRGSSDDLSNQLHKKPKSRVDIDGDRENGEDAGAPEDVDVSNETEVLDVMTKAIQVYSDQLDFLDIEDSSLSYRSLVVQFIVEETMAAGEKVLIFSHSLPTLDYLEIMLQGIGCQYDRIDGTRAPVKRQQQVKDFNNGIHGASAFLISTKAGGLGLNVQGATRVIIYDYGWNPSWEEQAIGRAYRLGQKKPVFVYRFKTGGTYEDVTFNSTVFKTQLFSRVVDHRTISRRGDKVTDAAKYLFDPSDPQQLDLDESRGKDPKVLDRVLGRVDCIRGIDLTETFAEDINEELTEQELHEANQELELERLQRENPEEYQKQRLAIDATRRAAIGPQAKVLGASGHTSGSPDFALLAAAMKQPPPSKIDEAARQGNMIELPFTTYGHSSIGDQSQYFVRDGTVPSKTSDQVRPPMSAKSPTENAENTLPDGMVLDQASIQKLLTEDAQGCKTQ